MNQVIGNLDKMKTSCPENGGVVEYSLVMGGKPVLDLNPIIGKQISWSFNNKINCVHCGIPIKKVFGQGSCWNCFTKLACNDMCIMKPETCHYSKGTCREPQWGEKIVCVSMLYTWRDHPESKSVFHEVETISLAGPIRVLRKQA